MVVDSENSSFYFDESFNKQEFEIFLNNWNFSPLEKEVYIRKKFYEILDEEINEIYPFTGILDVLGKLLDVFPEEILFLDLETTGYYLNTSNLPFLIGCGYYHNKNFIIEQILILDITREIYALEYIEHFIKKFKYIATYNGKKFDIPLLKSRFVFHSKKFEESFYHFDLYHFWKRLLPKKFDGGYSQKNLERKIIKIFRENDIDGSIVPQIYYDWNKYRKFDEFYKIILHNEWDVYHMFLLLNKALKIIKEKDKIESKLELAKLFFRNRYYQDAINLLEKFKSEKVEEQIQANKILYKSFYKLQNWDKTIEYLKKNIQIYKDPKEILILIRVLQNKKKNYKEALFFIDELIEIAKYLPENKKNPYLQLDSLKKRKQKILNL